MRQKQTAAGMTPEQFGHMLAGMRDKIVNFHLYEKKVPNQGNRSYLFRKKGSPSFGSIKRNMQRGNRSKWGYTGVSK